jgi:hypothetical protein
VLCRLWQSAVMNGAKHPGSRRHGRRRSAWLAGFVALVLLLVPVVVVFLGHHRPKPESEVTAFGIGIALATLWVAWAAYLDSGGSRAEIVELSLAEVADQLAASVHAQWEAEARARGLNDPWPLPVRWGAAEGSLADRWEALVRLATSGRGWPPPVGIWADSPDQLAGGDRELARVLGRIPTGRLVVLGEPGAGKTMLMVGLTLDLLARRASGGVVPVLVSLSSWDPVHLDLHEWLAIQLAIDHPSLAAAAPPRSVAGNRIAALLEAGLLLLLLDGLDEIPDAVRGSAVTKINDALRPGQKVVVTCRTEQYKHAVRLSAGTGGPLLRASAAVELGPLNAADVSGYFRDTAGPGAGARWHPVLAALGTDAPCGQALTTPLMVALARIIYNPRHGELAGTQPDPADLCDTCALPDRAAVEQHLFDAFIPAAYRGSVIWPDRRRRSRTAQQAERWLVFIAGHLENVVSSPGLAWWELERAVPRTVTTITAAIAAVLGLALTIAATAGSTAGLTAGLITGAAAGLVVLVAGHGSRKPLTGVGWSFRPARWFKAWRNNPLGNVRSLGIPPFAIVALLAGLNFGLPAVVAWLLLGLLALGVHGAYGDLTDVASPQAVLARDRRTLLLLGLTGGIFAIGAGLVLGTAAGRAARLLLGMKDAPAAGTAAGLVFGLVSALGFVVATTAWPRWELTCGWLALRQHLPWRLMSFLQDAHKRGVLRQAGAVYQFRHLELQHRLASRPSAPPTATNDLP